MMLYPAMNDLLAQVPNRYMLVNVVASRARKIAAQAELDNEPLEDKAVSIAIREVAAGQVDTSTERAEALAMVGELAPPPVAEEAPAPADFVFDDEPGADD